MPLLFFALLLLLPGFGTPLEEARHPHFKKSLVIDLGREAKTLKLDFQSAHCNEEEFKKAPIGFVWHLAGARIETASDLVIGGQTVKALAWNLAARKVEKNRWELVLDPLARGGFNTKLSKDAIALKTTYDQKAPRLEHLNIDVHPAGDGESLAILLEVRFHESRATTRIELP